MKKANPKTVGGFVLGAVAIGVAAVMVFGSGRFFAERETFVAFFPGSLQGLRIGASVDFRGVQVGTVTDLWVEVDDETLKFTMPVLMTIDYSRFRGVSGDEAEPSEDEKEHMTLIKRGLRAQLAAQSLVTGQQSIQLGFHPDTEAKLHETDLPYQQFPTIPSTFEKVEAGLGDVVTGASNLIAQVNDLVSENNRMKIEDTLTDLRDVMRMFKEDVPMYRKLVNNADETLTSYKALAVRAEGILAENQEGINKAITGLEKMRGDVSALAQRATKLVEDNEKGLTEFTNTGLVELTNLAVDAQAAAEQIRRVMEEMERDPARFFLGEPGQVEVQ